MKSHSFDHLVGRGRALEIVLGANDFDGETAERFGYVNRALRAAELDGFVDALARRMPPSTAVPARQRIQALLERGLQREVDFEKRWPEVLGTLVIGDRS